MVRDNLKEACQKERRKVMTSEEINIFTKEVYKQCIDRNMTCDEFNLFVYYMTTHKEAVNSALRRQFQSFPLTALKKERTASNDRQSSKED